MARAVELHGAGRLDEAALLYQKVLDEDEASASALNLLGVLYHQRGDDERAVEAIARALALEPNAPIFHANLAQAYRALGQMERAVGSCRLALKLWPDCPEALFNLGLSLHDLGELEEAVTHFRRALELCPDLAPVHNNLGLVLKELGRIDEALEHFRRAVEKDPALAAGHVNLAQILLDRDLAEEALPHCREAVRLQPDLPAANYMLGNAMRLLRRHLDARAAYLEALRLDPDLALAHAHLGLTLVSECRYIDAFPWLQEAVRLDPDNATFHQYLGDLYVEWHRPDDAIPCLERSLKLSSNDNPDLHISLGSAFQHQGRSAEAREHFELARQLQPDSAVVYLNLGAIHEAYGDLSEAEARFRQALSIMPDFAKALAGLADLLRGNLPETDRAALEDRLCDPQLSKGSRTRLLFALAHVLDARGEYARAARCLTEANALSRQLNQLRGASFSSAYEESFTCRLLEVFTPGLFSRLAGRGAPVRRPVFVFGLPRSGTTLIEQILASHPLIYGAGELPLADRSFAAIPSILGRKEPPVDCIEHLDVESVHRLAAQHLDWLSPFDGGRAERVVDKMPGNYIFLGFLALLFPKATFIHCRRDLRDVAISCWMTDFREMRWANDIDSIASNFSRYRRLMDHWRSVLPVPIHEVDYEEMVADLAGVARRLVAACGLDWEPACLQFHLAPRPVNTASATQVRQPIYSRSVGRWRNYETVLADLFSKLPTDDRAGAP